MLEDVRVIIHTAKGDLEATLFPSKAPIAVANFLNLAHRKYFDGLTFHRVVPQFVIQGGDPMGNGTGDPGYRFENEIDSTLSHQQVGTLAMANAGPDTNGSQFYVTLVPLAPGHIKALDGKYTIFGQVTQGVDVANRVQQGDKIVSIAILDPISLVIEAQKDRVAKWNKTLDRKFGSRLGPVPG